MNRKNMGKSNKLFDLIENRGGIVRKIFKYNPIRYLWGWRIYTCLHRKYKYYIVLNNHIGEAVFTCSYVKELKEEKKIDKIVAISKKSLADICLMFNSIDKVIILSNREISALCVYLNNKSHDKYSAINSIWDNRRTINIYKKYWLEVQYQDEWLLSRFYSDYLNLIEKSNIEKPIVNDEKSIVQFIKENAIQKGKSLIIIPDANTYPMMPDEFWNKIATFFMEKKYNVYINSNKEHNIICNGYIMPKLADITAIVNYAGVCISIQCGLSDLLVAADCPCYVIQTGNAESQCRQAIEGAPFAIKHLFNTSPYRWKETSNEVLKEFQDI